jgi:hypothetical protein
MFGLDALEKRKTLAPKEIRTVDRPACSLVAIPTEQSSRSPGQGHYNTRIHWERY